MEKLTPTKTLTSVSSNKSCADMHTTEVWRCLHAYVWSCHVCKGPPSVGFLEGISEMSPCRHLRDVVSYTALHPVIQEWRVWLSQLQKSLVEFTLTMKSLQSANDLERICRIACCGIEWRACAAHDGIYWGTKLTLWCSGFVQVVPGNRAFCSNHYSHPELKTLFFFFYKGWKRIAQIQ